jgi:hypothetical protein
MQGVTTAIVAFVLLCIVFPSLVKNRTQYYGAVAMVLGMILLDGIARAAGPGSGFASFAYLMTALLQIGAILVLFLAAGGLSPRELADDMSRAYEVMRRGEEEKEIIIPRTGEQPMPREQTTPERIELDSPPAKDKNVDDKGSPLA